MLYVCLCISTNIISVNVFKYFFAYLLNAYLIAALKNFKFWKMALTIKELGHPCSKLLLKTWETSVVCLLTFPEGPSTVFCVAVTAWTVVIRPSTISKLSWMTLARGARQLVVQEALETTFSDGSYVSWFTPTTNMGASALGAEMITFLAPPSKWAYNR